MPRGEAEQRQAVVTSKAQHRCEHERVTINALSLSNTNKKNENLNKTPRTFTQRMRTFAPKFRPKTDRTMDISDIEFHHSLPIQLRFNDVDKFGHVNNTVYFSFYDLGKTEYFGSVCPGVDWEKTGIVVVHIEADFVRQIFGSDHVAVQTAVSEIGTKSFHLIQRVVDTDTQETKCVCQSVMVTFDLEKHESVPLREEWVEAICRYEGRDLRKKKG